MRKAMWFACALLAGTAHAQMFKCMVNGRAVYQQSACADERTERGIGGTTTTIDAMPQSVINRTNARAAQERAREEQAPKMSVVGGQSPGPSDQDVKNLETSASSKTISEKERKFLQQEVERARAAQQSGNYTQQDLDRLKDAQAAQNRIDSRDREAARNTAEAIHLQQGSAATKAEVMQSRQAEEDRKNARRAGAMAGALRAAPAAPVAWCDGGGCWVGATHLQGGANGVYTGAGKTCYRQGDKLTCN